MTADSLSEGPAGPKLRIRPQELEEKPSEFRWSKGGKCVHQKAHRPARYRSVTEERRKAGPSGRRSHAARTKLTPTLRSYLAEGGSA